MFAISHSTVLHFFFFKFFFICLELSCGYMSWFALWLWYLYFLAQPIHIQQHLFLKPAFLFNSFPLRPKSATRGQHSEEENGHDLLTLIQVVCYGSQAAHWTWVLHLCFHTVPNQVLLKEGFFKGCSSNCVGGSFGRTWTNDSQWCFAHIFLFALNQTQH